MCYIPTSFYNNQNIKTLKELYEIIILNNNNGNNKKKMQ